MRKLTPLLTPDEMNTLTPLFTPDEMMRFQAKLRRALFAASLSPLIIVFLVILGVALLGLGFIEYEIVYRIFDYLSGDQDYWSPQIMGLTAAIMIVGYHVLAEKYPNNGAVRIVDFIVRILIPVYLIGAGLFIASMLYSDGLGEIAANQDIPLVIGAIPDTVVSGSWLDWLFANVTSPLAVAGFSLGIGGLAVVNIFVAHDLLKKIRDGITNVSVRLKAAKESVSAYTTIKRTQRDYAEKQLDAGDLALRNDNYLIRQISGEVLGVVEDALLPHKIWLKENEYKKEHSFEPEGAADPKQVAKDIAKIESITQAEIIAALQPQYLEDLR